MELKKLNSEKMIICVENSVCYIYNIEDWEILRRRYRIVGEILGNNLSVPSLPLKLLPEEALLLKRKGIAKFVSYSKIKAKPSDAEKQIYNEFKKNLFENQKLIYNKIRKDQINNVIDKIVIGKRKRGDTRCKEEIFTEELNKSCIIDHDTMLWPIFFHHSNVGNPMEMSEDVILKQTTPIKVAVFIELWNRGYYITPGNKFGGDFLLYLGDPILHHSINIVNCVLDMKKNYHVSELIAFSRLATSVKKKTLLGTVKNDGTVLYITLNWIDI